jgi:hypothetical protein
VHYAILPYFLCRVSTQFRFFFPRNSLAL